MRQVRLRNLSNPVSQWRVCRQVHLRNLSSPVSQWTVYRQVYQPYRQAGRCCPARQWTVCRQVYQPYRQAGRCCPARQWTVCRRSGPVCSPVVSAIPVDSAPRPLRRCLNLSTARRPTTRMGILSRRATGWRVGSSADQATAGPNRCCPRRVSRTAATMRGTRKETTWRVTMRAAQTMARTTRRLGTWAGSHSAFASMSWSTSRSPPASAPAVLPPWQCSSFHLRDPSYFPCASGNGAQASPATGASTLIRATAGGSTGR